MRRRTPREKKELEYTKDHINSSEDPHAFRKNWPRKKARANRAYRRKVHTLLTNLTARQDDDLLDKTDPRTVRKEFVQKWPVIPYGEIVKNRPIWRIERMGHNFFRYDYESSRDRERFARFLGSHIGSHTEKARIFATVLQEILGLSERPIHIQPHYGLDRQYVWLRAFFQDEPEWEKRILAWIASFD